MNLEEYFASHCENCGPLCMCFYTWETLDLFLKILDLYMWPFRIIDLILNISTLFSDLWSFRCKFFKIWDVILIMVDIYVWLSKILVLIFKIMYIYGGLFLTKYYVPYYKAKTILWPIHSKHTHTKGVFINNVPGGPRFTFSSGKKSYTSLNSAE